MTSPTPVPNITLNNGVEMPQVGFGVWQVPEEETAEAVRHALDAGYRSIDTAAIYGNEKGVGRAIAECGIPRDELFITTKLWNAEHGYDTTLRAFDASLEKLGIDVLDLYLIHWPLPARGLFVDTYRAMEKLLADGRVRSIGVSNFLPSHLDRLLKETDVIPVVNQIELHPRLQQQALRDYGAAHGIHTEAYSPLAQGEVLEDSTVTAIAERLGVTPGQVVLRWHFQLGNIIIPKSVTPERIRSNIDLFGFELSESDMAAIAGLEDGHRTGANPEEVNE